MSSHKSEIKFVGRVYLVPPKTESEETIIDILKKIKYHPRLETVRVAILASPKSKKQETFSYGKVKIKTSDDCSLPRTVYKITDKYSEDDLIDDLERMKKDVDYKHNVDLRYYIDEIDIIDKGDIINKAEIYVVFKKIDEIENPNSPIAIEIAPETMPLDVSMLFRQPEWKKTINKETKEEVWMWKKTKKNKIENISLHNKGTEFVEPQYVHSHTRNLFDSDICKIRECQMEKSWSAEWTPVKGGMCKEGDKDNYR